MFIKLTHGLHSIINAIVSYIQKWTDDSVPDNTKTIHDFKDGLGKRPAVPYDDSTHVNNIIDTKIKTNLQYDKNDLNNSENILKVELKHELVNGNDDFSSKNSIENVVCVPNPVIFEILNGVPEKIDRVIPVKTQALPRSRFCI